MYIITTKPKSLTMKLLKVLGVEIPEHRVFGLGSGKKVHLAPPISSSHLEFSSLQADILERLIKEHGPGARCVARGSVIHLKSGLH